MIKPTKKKPSFIEFRWERAILRIEACEFLNICDSFLQIFFVNFLSTTTNRLYLFEVVDKGRANYLNLSRV